MCSKHNMATNVICNKRNKVKNVICDKHNKAAKVICKKQNKATNVICDKHNKVTNVMSLICDKHNKRHNVLNVLNIIISFFIIVTRININWTCFAAVSSGAFWGPSEDLEAWGAFWGSSGDLEGPSGGHQGPSGENWSSVQLNYYTHAAAHLAFGCDLFLRSRGFVQGSKPGRWQLFVDNFSLLYLLVSLWSVRKYE